MKSIMGRVLTIKDTHLRVPALSAVFFALLGLIGETRAVASTIRDDRSQNEYLNLATLPEFKSVGTFVNNWGFTGSGTLIAPDWVLTGAHMFAAASSGTFTIDGTSYTTSHLYSNPNWINGDVFAGFDFGLAQLSEPVVGVTPATIYGGSSEVGQLGTFVGYGITGTGLTGYQPPADGQKRAFQNVIDGDFGKPSILLGSDFDNPMSEGDSDFGSTVPVDLEGMVAPGDSGGGVFITIDSVTYLAGVISFVASSDGQNNADYGDVAGLNRVSVVLPWITRFSSIPEPSTSILLALGFSVYLCCASWLSRLTSRFCRFAFRRG